MIKWLFTFFCIIFYCTAYSQDTDPVTTIPVELGRTIQYQSTADWVKTSFYQDKKKGVEILNYERKAVETEAKKRYVATQACKTEPARGADIKTYSLTSLAFFQKKKDFKILKTITHTDGLLQISYAIGYWAVYTDDTGVVHKVIIIHGIHPNGKGFQFFVDCPEPVFVTLEEEITAQVRSLQIK